MYAFNCPCASISFDGFFLRTASYDIPAEDKSAFALEMDDVRVMLRDSSRRSLALVDELGKGTSARCSAACTRTGTVSSARVLVQF